MTEPSIILVAFALLFAFLNGFGDSASIVATMISSRAMTARRALLLSTVAHMVAPFLFGVAVAEAIGRGVVAPGFATMSVVLSGVIGAIVWNVLTSILGIPSSSSHSLVGGLVGGAIAAQGLDSIHFPGLSRLVVVLLFSPPLGFLGGYLLMKLVLFLVRSASPRINWFFKRMQLGTALVLALSHSTNDTQMTMGIITMGLVSAGVVRDFTVPLPVTVISTLAMALGTSLGGWRTMRTLGGKFYKIRPVHSFTSQMASASVIFGAALVGGPVSATQVISSSILGVGSAERLGKVRWNVAGQILVAWVLTMPASGLVAALFGSVLKHIIQ